MNTVIRLRQMLVVPSLLVLARLRRFAVSRRIGQGILRPNQRFENMFVDPRPSDVDSMPSFNLIDGQPIR